MHRITKLSPLFIQMNLILILTCWRTGANVPLSVSQKVKMAAFVTVFAQLMNGFLKAILKKHGELLQNFLIGVCPVKLFQLNLSEFCGPYACVPQLQDSFFLNKWSLQTQFMHQLLSSSCNVVNEFWPTGLCILHPIRSQGKLHFNIFLKTTMETMDYFLGLISL